MTEKTNVPKIRFAGFTDPWEQRKFADFVTASGIRNSENLELPSYSVTNDRGFVPQDEQFENGGTMREADKTSYWIVEPKSFAYNPARINVGSIGYQSTSRNVIVSSLYEVFQADETCDNRFLWHWFKTRLFTQQIEMLQEGGVRLYFFFDKLLKSGISMPSVDEQRLIGEQFDRIDHLITLHQRKHEKLVQLKKSMLDKMFPKPGETEPEIRFAGFTDPWEQRKLGDVTAVYDGVHQTPDYQDEGVMFLSVENIETLTSQKFISREAFARDYPVYPKRGDVLMTRIGDIGTSNVVETDDKLAFYVSLALLKPLNVDSYYLDKSLQSPSAKMELYRRTLHIAFPKKINKNQIAEVMLPIPRSRQEQEQIGALFRDLDTLITLHQRKLELLRNTKKSLLERMFV